MKAITLEILQKIMNTELVEVSGEVFDKVKDSQGYVRSTEIRDTSGERNYGITYYIVDGNIIGSWEHFSGVVRLEKSLVPERQEGWYKAKLGSGISYNSSSYCMVFYNSLCKKYSCREHKFDLEDFEWVDDNPIKFPEE